jgi:hypothetical protein
LTGFFSIELKTGYGKKTKSKAKKHNGDKVEIHNNWSLMDELDSRQDKVQFYIFWDQAVRDADLSKREPLLIFRRNKKKSCIAIHEDLFNVCVDSFGNTSFSLMIIKKEDYRSIVVCNLEEFLEWSFGKFTEEFINDKLYPIFNARRNKRLKLKSGSK